MSHIPVHAPSLSQTATSHLLLFPHNSNTSSPSLCPSENPASHFTEKIKTIGKEFLCHPLPRPPLTCPPFAGTSCLVHLVPGARTLSPDQGHRSCSYHSVLHHHYPSLLDHSHEHTNMLLLSLLEISSLDPSSPTSYCHIYLPHPPALHSKTPWKREL